MDSMLFFFLIFATKNHHVCCLCDHLFVFCGDGVVKDFIGGYTEYRSYVKDYEAEQKRLRETAQKASKPAAPVAKAAPEKKKRSWKEEREFEALEKELETLNAEKTEIEAQLSGGTLSYEACQEASRRYGEVKALIDEKELRWLELSLY